MFCLAHDGTMLFQSQEQRLSLSQERALLEATGQGTGCIQITESGFSIAFRDLFMCIFLDFLRPHSSFQDCLIEWM